MKKKANTSVSTETATDLSKYTQENIPAMLAAVTAKITLLKGGIPKEATTKGKDLPGFGEITSIKTVQELVQAHSSVTNKARVYKESAEILDIPLKKYPFKLNGCSEEQWVADITSTIAIVKNKVELDKLTKTKALLEANLSAEAKLAEDLKKIAALIAE